MSTKMESHELISILKEMAAELGRVPTRNEFKFRVKGGEYWLSKYYGGYGVFLQAAGMDQPRVRQQKIDSSIFEKDISETLSVYEPREKSPHLEIKFTSTVIFGDLHFPFVHEDKLKKALEVLERVKPQRVVQVGDLYDCMSHAKFPRSMNIYTPKEEMALARKGAVKMWEDISKIVPNAECYQILGNHDSRPMKRILEQYPEIEMFVDFEKWFTFEGVQTRMDMRDELILDGIAYIHGYRSKLGEHMEYMRRPVICGHSHRPGVIFKNYGDATLFEMNVGYLGDPESKALSYTAQKHTHWSHSVGVLNEFGPQVILL